MSNKPVKEKFYFLKDGRGDNYKELIDWYGSLHDPDKKNIENKRPSKRADKAKLRRCSGPQEVLLQSEFYNINFLLRFYVKTFRENDQEQLMAFATIAGLWAHIKEHDASISFASQLGKPKESNSNNKNDKPCVSALRFNQLQKCQNWDDLYRCLRRAITMLGNRANILSLADSILHWSAEKNTTFVKSKRQLLSVRWAVDYFDQIAD